MALADLQRQLAASLAGRGPSPDGLEERVLERTRRSLESKRRRAAAHLLPHIRKALGSTWAERFHAHALRYVPDGLLHHVDDAWELAETLRREDGPDLRDAADSDLAALKLRYVREPKLRGNRIRERRGFLLAWVRRPHRALVVRLPGDPGKIWTLRLPF